MKQFLTAVFLFSFAGSFCQSASQSPKYEFRGVWVASVVNIDWPSRKDLTVDGQKAEFIRLADMHQRNGMNALVVQIRPVADAFYISTLEPWSEYLTGRQGMPPNPYYDPLKFMIEETHKRGMEFHAWLNPYRAVFHVTKSSIAPTHITKTHPDWFIRYGDQKIFDPGKPEVRAYVNAVVKEIVSNYDVDGIHLDDYFYPYHIDGKEFGDGDSYRKYGNGLSLADWRRSNCDSIIKQLNATVKGVNPRVRFGVSPFGVWRNKSDDPDGSNTRAGTTNYDGLYANILLWLKEGWIDYAAPQLYWEIGHHLCDYNILLPWWAQHAFGRQIFIGHAIYRAGSSAGWRDPKQLPTQVAETREQPNVAGSIYFSSKDFERNPLGWSDSLRLNYYRDPALIPPMPWIDTATPASPVITRFAIEGDSLAIEGNVAKALEEIKQVVIYVAASAGGLGFHPTRIVTLGPGRVFSKKIALSSLPAGTVSFVSATSVNRANNESALGNVVQLRRTDRGWLVRR